MDDLKLVRRMAERVRDATVEYAAKNRDFAEIIRERPGDVTRKIDMAAEEALDAAVLAEGISARIVSEEIGERTVPEDAKPEVTLLCDPVDGSNNFTAGVPYYCTTLAIARKVADPTFGDIVASAVSSPHAGTFSAERGKGAYLNDRPIRAGHMGHKLIYAVYAYGSGPMPAGLIKLQEENCIVRTMGSIALDICMVARGSFDAVIDSRDKVNGYDILAAALILEEAGGTFSLACGRSLASLPLDASGLSIIAASDSTIRERIFLVLEENGSF